MQKNMFKHTKGEPDMIEVLGAIALGIALYFWSKSMKKNDN